MAGAPEDPSFDPLLLEPLLSSRARETDEGDSEGHHPSRRRDGHGDATVAVVVDDVAAAESAGRNYDDDDANGEEEGDEFREEEDEDDGGGGHADDGIHRADRDGVVVASPLRAAAEKKKKKENARTVELVGLGVRAASLATRSFWNPSVASIFVVVVDVVPKARQRDRPELAGFAGAATAFSQTAASSMWWFPDGSSSSEDALAPGLLRLNDSLSSLTGGFSAWYLPVFLVERAGLSPVGLQCLCRLAVPLGQRTSPSLAKLLEDFFGPLLACLILQGSYVAVFASMLEVAARAAGEGRWRRTTICLLYALQGSLTNSTSGPIRELERRHRRRDPEEEEMSSHEETLRKVLWSSGCLAGALAVRERGLPACLISTAILQLLACLPLAAMWLRSGGEPKPRRPGSEGDSAVAAPARSDTVAGDHSPFPAKAEDQWSSSTTTYGTEEASTVLVWAKNEKRRRRRRIPAR